MNCSHSATSLSSASVNLPRACDTYGKTKILSESECKSFMIRASNSLEGIDENNATIGCPYCLPFCVTVILTQRGNLVAMPNIRGKHGVVLSIKQWVFEEENVLIKSQFLTQPLQ